VIVENYSTNGSRIKKAKINFVLVNSVADPQLFFGSRSGSYLQIWTIAEKTCLAVDWAGVEKNVQKSVIDEASHLGDGAQGEGLQPERFKH